MAGSGWQVVAGRSDKGGKKEEETSHRSRVTGLVTIEGALVVEMG